MDYSNEIEEEEKKLDGRYKIGEDEIVLDVAKRMLSDLQYLDPTVESMTLVFNSRILGRICAKVETDKK